MTQGSENDLKDIRFYTNTSKIDFVDDNKPIEDLNFNVLQVDNKAIAAETIATQADTDITTHIGGSGISEHGLATTVVAGFMAPSDKLKLDGVEAEAQINILSPLDALELVSRGVTRLHTHITATSINDGLMSAADKTKLNGIQAGAQVNILTAPQVATLTSGGDANSLHTHTTPLFEEFFKAGPGTDNVPPGVTYHTNVNHTGLPGVPGSFAGFTKVPYRLSPTIENFVGDPAFSSIVVFDFDYSPFLSDLAIVGAGIAEMHDKFTYDSTEAFYINDVSKSGLVGTVVFQVSANDPVPELPFPPTDWSLIAGDGLMKMSVFQSGFGIGV